MRADDGSVDAKGTGRDDEFLDRARALCVAAHTGQWRANGEPYHTHPFGVAELLVEHGVNDAEILAAAYLHDVLEDSDTPRKTIAAEYGERVAGMVDEMTLDERSRRSFETKQKALLAKARAMSDDAKWIKLADRLHNLRDKMPDWTKEKRRRYARASLKLLDALAPWPSAALADEIRQMAEAFAK